jgi:CcmD family protein
LLAQADTGSTPGYTGADERPVEVERRVQRSRFRYLMLGYGLVWLSLGAYLFALNRGIDRVGREIGDLRGRLQETDRGARR